MLNSLSDPGGSFSQRTDTGTVILKAGDSTQQTEDTCREEF